MQLARQLRDAQLQRRGSTGSIRLRAPRRATRLCVSPRHTLRLLRLRLPEGQGRRRRTSPAAASPSVARPWPHATVRRALRQAETDVLACRCRRRVARTGPRLRVRRSARRPGRIDSSRSCLLLRRSFHGRGRGRLSERAQETGTRRTGERGGQGRGLSRSSPSPSFSLSPVMLRQTRSPHGTTRFITSRHSGEKTDYRVCAAWKLYKWLDRKVITTTPDTPLLPSRFEWMRLPPSANLATFAWANNGPLAQIRACAHGVTTRCSHPLLRQPSHRPCPPDSHASAYIQRTPRELRRRATSEGIKLDRPHLGLWSTRA